MTHYHDLLDRESRKNAMGVLKPVPVHYIFFLFSGYTMYVIECYKYTDVTKFMGVVSYRTPYSFAKYSNPNQHLFNKWMKKLWVGYFEPFCLDS